MTLRNTARQAWLGIQLTVLRRKRLCLLGMVITDRCNLNCFYCESKNAGRVHLTFPEACGQLTEAHARGHRVLYLTGGEPMIWRDGAYTLRDVVAFARQAGFLHIIIYTNGTMPLDIPGCSYVVTVDGPKAVHDALRGGTYDRVLRNVSAAVTRAVVASITFSKANVDYLDLYVREISALGLFRGITFNLLTHRPDTIQKHGIVGPTRQRLLDDLWRLKRSGYPIELSHAAYRALRENRWKRPLPQVQMCIGHHLFECCRDIDNPSICQNCGYSGCAELAQFLALRPSALWQAFKSVRGSH